MASRYVCGICGRTVATFESWVDVDPSDVLDLMTAEVREIATLIGWLPRPSPSELR